MTYIGASLARLKVGDTMRIDGEDRGRVARVDREYIDGHWESFVQVIPELLYWNQVLGGLTWKMMPGHEPGIPRVTCGFCAGAGRLANVIDRQVIPIVCEPCDGLGWRPSTKIFTAEMLGRCRR
jgi:hypothetical protein